MASSFSYKPLRDGEIRLLRLRRRQGTSPGDAEGELECDITHCSLDNNPAFVGLSYTWGKGAPSRKVRMNNEVVLIADNLYELFRQALSHEICENHDLVETEELWWIDALCINQQDIPERNSQVSQMRRIYCQSSKIVIWLGPEADNSDLAFQAYEHYAKIIDLRGDEEERQSWLESLPREALEKLGQRNWWRRVWVWQEATSPNVPREFWCGKKRVSFGDVSAANEVIGMRRDFAATGAFAYNTKIYSMGQLTSTRAGNGVKVNISPLWLMNEALSLEATDPRDRVYAVLPIWDETRGLPSPSVVVDYGLSVDEVFREATVSMLKQSPNRPEVLKRCVCKPDGTFQDLSWVPDWSQSVASQPWKMFVDYFARTLPQSPDFEANVTIAADPKKIRLRALSLDSIKRIHTPIGIGEELITLEPGLWEARYRTWIRKLGEWAYPDFNNRPYVGGGYVSVAIDDLLDFNRNLEGPFQHWPVLEVANFNFAALPDPSAVLRDEPRHVVFGLNCLSLLETQEGYFGAALPGARAGDLLVGIPGIPCPVILQKHQDHKSWRIVGCTYVVGLSNRRSWGMGPQTTEFEIT